MNFYPFYHLKYKTYKMMLIFVHINKSMWTYEEFSSIRTRGRVWTHPRTLQGKFSSLRSTKSARHQTLSNRPCFSRLITVLWPDLLIRLYRSEECRPPTQVVGRPWDVVRWDRRPEPGSCTVGRNRPYSSRSSVLGLGRRSRRRRRPSLPPPLD